MQAEDGNAGVRGLSLECPPLVGRHIGDARRERERSDFQPGVTVPDGRRDQFDG